MNSVITYINDFKGNIEFYAAKKPKYDKYERKYLYYPDSIIWLMDTENQLYQFYKNDVTEYLNYELKDIHIKDYKSGNENFVGFLYHDSTFVNLEYNESLNTTFAAPGLVEKDKETYPYLIIKLRNEKDEDMLIYIKLKKAIKLFLNTLYVEDKIYNLQFEEKAMHSNNKLIATLQLDDIDFIMFKNDFFILKPERYQKYFDIMTNEMKRAEDLVYSNDQLDILDEVINKRNAKYVCDNFDYLNTLMSEINAKAISDEIILKQVETFNLSFTYVPDNKKFLLRTPKDLVSLIDFAAGCYVINPINNEKLKVKRPNVLEEL